MAELNPGDEVVRIKGDAYQIGAKGRIVDMTPTRVRVYWHSNPNPHTKPKRTWVLHAVVKSATVPQGGE